MRSLPTLVGVAGATMIALLAAPLSAQFTYAPAGELEDPTEGRDGYTDATVWVAGMTFPLTGDAYSNTQVMRPGGGWYHGPLSGECHVSNYQYPWSDNYCESRDNDSAHRPLLCDIGYGHAGQDIRPASCTNRTHAIVSATAGMVTNVGSMSVTVTDSLGRQFQYLHMQRADAQRFVRVGQTVAAGDQLATVSNNPGTTIHLHFQMRWSVSGTTTWIPPYSSLVAAYGGGATYPSAAAPRLRSPVEDVNETAFFCHGDWRRRRTDHQCRTVSRQQFGTSFGTEAGTPVYAAAAGQIVRAVDGTAGGSRTGGGLGNQVMVLHAGGRATLYGRLRSGLPVREGDSVECGDLLGHTQGTELYFEVRDGVTTAASWAQRPPIDPYSGECSQSYSLWAGDAPGSSCETNEADDAALVSATYPREVAADGGQSLMQTWTVRNSGTTTWTSEEGYALVYDAGEGYRAPMRIDLPVGASVAPGATQVFSLPATVPMPAGRYAGRWRMSHDMEKFGQTFSLTTRVSAPATGRSCRSATLGRNVASGECVQVNYAGCGASRCAFYRCENGAFTCAGASSCSTRHASASCPPPSTPMAGGTTTPTPAPACESLGCRDCMANDACGWCDDESRCMSLTTGAGLTQDGMEIPRRGVNNPTLANWQRATGSRTRDGNEPYGETVTRFGGQYVQGTISHFGGASDRGVSSTETGSITGERLRALNDPPNPSAAAAAANASNYYYCAMRFAYPGPADDPDKAAWQNRRIMLVNPTTGARVVVRPVDWGPNTNTGRLIDVSPQAMRDLGLSTDQNVLVSFAPTGTPLGVQSAAAEGTGTPMCAPRPRDPALCDTTPPDPVGMCAEQFRGCDDNESCCDSDTNTDIQCFAGICDDQAQCRVWGEACTPGGRTLPDRCCGNMQCATQAAGNQCCVAAGGDCRSEADCCGDMTCGADGRCVGRTDGSRCWSTFECSGSSVCVGGSCGRPR